MVEGIKRRLFLESRHYNFVVTLYGQEMKKGNRFERICPICGKVNLKYLSDHLSSVHTLSSSERKPYLKRAKYQGINVYHGDESSISKIKRVGVKEITKSRTIKYNVKQALKRIKKSNTLNLIDSVK